MSSPIPDSWVRFFHPWFEVEDMGRFPSAAGGFRCCFAQRGRLGLSREGGLRHGESCHRVGATLSWLERPFPQARWGFGVFVQSVLLVRLRLISPIHLQIEGVRRVVSLHIVCSNRGTSPACVEC